ncbi:MAG: SPFH domain-containing protein [Candidatus Omnitrophota bacterium]
MRIRIGKKVTITLVLICISLSIGNIALYGLGKKFESQQMGIEKLEKPIVENLRVIYNNEVTNDKKYISLIVSINWRIDQLSKPVKGFYKVADIIENLNRYLSMKTRFAVNALLVDIPSSEIEGRKDRIEKTVLKKVRADIRSHFVSVEDVYVTNIKIEKFIILEKKYFGAGFPPTGDKGDK